MKRKRAQRDWRQSSRNSPERFAPKGMRKFKNEFDEWESTGIRRKLEIIFDAPDRPAGPARYEVVTQTGRVLGRLFSRKQAQAFIFKYTRHGPIAAKDYQRSVWRERNRR